MDTTVERNLRYGQHDHQLMDLYLPAAARSPGIVIMMHGGAWQAGNKEFDAERCALWASWGYVVANIEYALATPARPSWPQPYLDLGEAVEWLHGAKLGIDVPRQSIGVAGVSAGAHLAALRSLQDPRVSPAILMAGVYDLVSLWRHGRLTRVDDPTAALLGGDPDDVPQLYAEASPQSLLRDSKYQGIARGTRYLLLWTEDDRVAPVTQQEVFARSLEVIGAAVEYHSFPQGGHFGWSRLPGLPHPGGGMEDPPNPEANRVTRAFLADAFAPE